MTNKCKINAVSTLIGRMPYISDKWRECIIWAQHERGVYEVQADVIGACGVHLVGNRWHITHIPTGRMAFAFRYAALAHEFAERFAMADGLNSTHLGRVRRLVAGVIAA